jgi:hypothetical protein
MYYFNLLVCLVGVVAALSFLKSLDLSSSLTITLGIATMLLGVFGIAWFSAKDSAAEAAKNTASAAITAKKPARMQVV